MNYRALDKLMHYADRHKNGFTITIRNGVIKSVKPSNRKRFVVASEKIIDITKEKTVIYINDFKNGFFGGYQNKNTFEIEHVYFFNSKMKAVLFGQKKRQYSIYDLIDDKELKIRRTNHDI